MGSSWLIIGASRGIGLGFAEYLVDSRPNDTIYATARNVSAAKELGDIAARSNGRLRVLQADVLDAASMEKAGEEIMKINGSLDHVVVNAGVAVGRGNIENVTGKDLDDNISINVIGAQNSIRATYKLVEASSVRRKTIAVVSTGPSSLTMIEKMEAAANARWNVDQYQMGAYSVSKTAVNMLTRVWALKLNKSGIALPLLHPGSVDTANTKGLDKSQLISPIQSAAALVKVIETADIARTKEGILSYDGSVIPW